MMEVPTLGQVIYKTEVTCMTEVPTLGQVTYKTD